MKNCSSVVILVNGALPTHKKALDALSNASFIICCDGAVHKLEMLGLAPDLIVGDLDSIGADARKRYSDILFQDENPEICDLQKSLLYCKNHRIGEATIVGAMGLREDHVLANLSILSMYGRSMSLKMITDYGIFTPICQNTVFSSFAGQQVSVFNFDKAMVSYKNLRYPVENRQFHYFWEGSLNESLGDEFEIEVREGTVLVFQTH